MEAQTQAGRHASARAYHPGYGAVLRIYVQIPVKYWCSIPCVFFFIDRDQSPPPSLVKKYKIKCKEN
jgi:hypothetical protein